MGNQASSSSGDGAGGTSNNGNPAQQALRKILQPNNNALGLTRAELDERCRPSGLYASCQWDDKAIRRLIGDGKLAARLKGKEDAADADHECPICFFNYSEINVTKCCNANICTECYLQVKPQKSSSKNKQGKVNHHNCPFCNAARFQVSVATAPAAADGVGTGTMTEQALSPSADQQQQQKLEGSNTIKDGTITPPSEQSSPKISTPPTTGFGSHLERNERVAMMRARSSSMSESQSNSTLQSPEQEITSLAMTPEERRALQSEIRAQHNHPLTMRLEQEEAERRMRNEMEYYQQRMLNNNNQAGGRRTIADVRRQAAATATNAGASSSSSAGGMNRLPPRGARDWNRLVDALEQRSNNNAGAGGMDDLAVLEAALMLSMEEEARRRGEPPPRSSSILPNVNSFDRTRLQHRLHHHQVVLSEEEQLAMAIAASLREQSAAVATAENNSNHNNNNQENNTSDDDADEA